MTIVAVEELNIKLYKLFVKQLTELNIGYSFNEKALIEMMDIINAIDYIKHGYAYKSEIHKIISIYGEK